MSKFTLTELVSLVEGKTGHPAQKRGNGYQCRCPAHEDDSPSLSIAKGDKQPYVLHCHAGCSHNDIMAALGVAPPSLNGDAPTAVPKEGKLVKTRKPKKTLGKLVARYPYYDAEGNFLYEKRRYDPKTFRIKHSGGWGLGGHDPVLYNLPQILATPLESIIFICEGEKDAAAVGLFATATCNFDGASKNGQAPKWRSSYNQWLKGRRVVVLADKDDAGRAHATAVAESTATVAEWVKVVEFPNLPEHGDTYDWLEAGGTVDQLIQLVEKATKVEARPRDFKTDNPATDDYRKGFRWLGYQIRLNILDNTVEINGKPIDDVQEAHLRSAMFDAGFKGKGRMQDALLVEAGHNRYHPIKEMLEGLEWDGTDTLARLLNDYIDLDVPEGFGYAAFKRWMIGAIAKVYTGTRNYMLVWDGGQEVGKSTLARWLNPLPEYHHEGQINPEDKDHLRYLATKFTWEVAEVDATVKRADIAALKDFISKQEVTVRPAYARYDLVRPSLASLIGTINGDGAGFLRDKTGSSRFLTIRIATVNFDYMADLDSAQIWAQAYHWYKSGEPWRLTREEEIQRNAINSEYETETYLETLFSIHYQVDPARTDVWCSSIEILEMLEEKGLNGSQRLNLIELQTILQKRGAIKTRKVDSGKKQTVYLGVWYSNSPDAEIEEIPI